MTERESLLGIANSVLAALDCTAMVCSLLYSRDISINLMKDKIDDLLDIRHPLLEIIKELENEG